MASVAAAAPSAGATAAALDLHRSLARDCNLLCDQSNRLGRKAAAKKIAEVLGPVIARTKPKVAAAAAPKPKLIFSAKAAAAAAAAAVPAPEPVATSPAASNAAPAPLTAEQIEAIALLDSLLHLPGASGSQTLLSLLIARISDEMENVRAQVLQLSLDLVGAIGSHASQSLLPEFLPVIYARLSPSAASISAAASFAATSMPSSSIGAALASSAHAVSIQSGIAIPSSTGLTLGVGGSGLSGGGAGTGVHLEPSEELRLKLLQLLLKLVECEKAKHFARLAAASSSATQSPSSSDSASSSPPLQIVYGSLDKLVAIVLKTVNDPFPDLKKASCDLVTLLAELLALNPQGITHQARNDAANALQKALLPNLKHQHSQVRLQSLSAFGSVVRQMGGESLSSATIDALPVLSSLLGDRTPKVREVFIVELSGWLISLPRLLPSAQTKFLGLLLNLTADEVPEIARAAVNAINTAAAKLEEWRTKEEAMGDDPAAASGAAADSTFLTSVKDSPSSTAVAMSVDSTSSDADWLPASLAAPFTSRPPAAARAFVRQHSQDLLPPILQELSDWTLAKRVVAAGSLKALLVYLEDGVIPSLIPLLQSLLKSIRDESSAVHGSLSGCAELLGFFLRDPSVYLEWILPELERNAESTYRNSLLMVLLNLIKGMPILIQAGATTSAAAAATATTVATADKEALAANEAKIARIFPLLLNTLSSPDLCCSDDAPLRLQLHRILVCVLSRIPRQCGSRLFADKIFHMIVQLDTKSVPAVGSAAAVAAAGSAVSEEEKQVMAALELLARCELQTGELQLPASSASPPTSAQLLQAVYTAHFPRELSLLLGPDVVASPSTAADSLPATWGQGASKDAAVNFVALTFFQLLDRAAGISTMGLAAAAPAPSAAASSSSSSSAAATAAPASSSSPVSLLLESSLPTLLPVLIHSARPSNDHAIRSLVLNFVYKLALLHGGAILRASDPSLRAALITEVLVPQTVWKSGKVAAALRFHALTVLHALFSQGLVTAPIVMQTAAKLLPVLHANLDDDEAKMRMLVLLLLQSLMLLVPAGSIRVGDDSLTELHRDLLKRLDDSHDDIRLEVVATFTLLFHRVFPPAEEYDKTQSYFRYILQTFYIHLDDSNPRIIGACFEFLKSSIDYDRKVFINETEAAKKKQTTGQYCDQLLAMAREKQ